MIPNPETTILFYYYFIYHFPQGTAGLEKSDSIYSKRDEPFWPNGNCILGYVINSERD